MKRVEIATLLSAPGVESSVDPRPTEKPETESFQLSHWSIGFARPDVGTSPSAPDPAATPVAFSLRRKIGEGGFGEVWESVQQSLGRLIAVKRVRQNLYHTADEVTSGSHRLEQAFRQEALTAANLEHPNIVPVHDLGLDEDGRPLLAMKLVRGRPWDEIIREDFASITVPEFLARHLPILCSVTQAVAFAHSRGIVHRDIKASQVMIGEFGETLLMDWGLAIVYDEDLLRSATGQSAPGIAPSLAEAGNPAGTPAYMAPEQSTNTAEGIGPWTDIYLLGGTLFFLLAGVPPHKSDTSERLRYQAMSGYVLPIADQNPWREKPPELVALALKALSPAPGDRVPSAREFLAALQDYMTGAARRRESISLTDQVGQRMAALGSDYREYNEVAVLLANATTLWPENPGIAPLRQRLLLGNARVAVDHGDLVLARFHANLLPATDPDRGPLLDEVARREAEEREAAAELDRAHRQLREQHDAAEELLGFMLGDLRDRLQSIGRLDVLNAVADRALAYFSSLPPERLGRVTVARRTRALHQIGEARMAQGNLDGAMQAFQEALVLARDLALADPGNIVWQTDFAESNALAGKVLRARGDLDGALAYFEKRKVILEGLLELHPGIPEILHSLALAHDDFADVLAVRGDIAGAVEHNRLLREIVVSLLLREERLPWLRTMRTALANHGWLRKAQGDLDGALEQYKAARVLAERLVAADPQNARDKTDVAFMHNKLAWVLEARDDLDGAITEFRTSLAILSDLGQRDPTNADLQRLLAVTHVRMATLLHRRGEHDAAARGFADAVTQFKDLVQREQGNVFNINWLAQAHIGRGRALRRLLEFQKARDEWNTALNLVAPLVQPLDRAELRHVFTYAQALHYLERHDDAAPYAARLHRMGYKDSEFLRLFGDQQATNLTPSER